MQGKIKINLLRGRFKKIQSRKITVKQNTFFKTCGFHDRKDFHENSSDYLNL